MDSDDLVLGAIVARQTASQMDQFYLLKQLQQTAAMEERVRLARDLHDGLLQSLTAAALQLQTVHQHDGRGASSRPGTAGGHTANDLRRTTESPFPHPPTETALCGGCPNRTKTCQDACGNWPNGSNASGAPAWNWI